MGTVILIYCFFSICFLAWTGLQPEVRALNRRSPIPKWLKLCENIIVFVLWPFLMVIRLMNRYL